jgi:c-di-GMP-binding flagellar brake protein YcgR
MQERRQYSRVPMAALVAMQSKKENRLVGRGFITNLSEGGMGMESADHVPMNEDMIMKFTLMNGWSFEVPGKVKYSKGGVLTRAYGTQFSGLNSYDATRIRNFVEAQLKNERPDN